METMQSVVRYGAELFDKAVDKKKMHHQTISSTSQKRHESFFFLPPCAWGCSFGDGHINTCWIEFLALEKRKIYDVIPLTK